MYASMIKFIQTPIVLIYADPAPLSQKVTDQVLKLMQRINDESRSTVELIPFKGTHHFHMLDPAAAAEITLEQLREKYVYCIECEEK